MCDVTFQVGSDKSSIKAHKYMLASASPVFYSMFEGPLAEKGDVEIADIASEHFTECLKLIVESDNLNCDEGIIFQRMVQWAKLRCGEQNKPTTDESVRNSLGDLLHLIRFPCMEPRFFTEEVSSTNILTFEEKVKIYEHFNLKWNDIFISKRRLGEIIHVVRCKVDTDSFFF
ncbi:unnamed protein product [Mytilus edulis]|uniref:BTB domain-containing protein n=1 Tax=Mytilus edulis TaxID=6550 RepID=A0A8S3SV74_MYTED|nr:unnamed protein product [Mytilus edulis]